MLRSELSLKIWIDILVMWLIEVYDKEKSCVRTIPQSPGAIDYSNGRWMMDWMDDVTGGHMQNILNVEALTNSRLCS
jgi:hypothetical protein